MRQVEMKICLAVVQFRLSVFSVFQLDLRGINSGVAGNQKSQEATRQRIEALLLWTSKPTGTFLFFWCEDAVAAFEFRLPICAAREPHMDILLAEQRPFVWQCPRWHFAFHFRLHGDPVASANPVVL